MDTTAGRDIEPFVDANRAAEFFTSCAETGIGKTALRCYIHGAQTDWRKRADGDLVCERCHPSSVGSG